MGEELRVVGSSAPRVDAVDKVTGAARYAVDEFWDGCLHGAILRADRAHAEIREILTGDAARQPGVVRVVTGADAHGIAATFGHHIADHPALAIDRVRYYGEPVAVVVANSRVAAEDALQHVRVRYDELPALMDVEQALAPDAPLIHPNKPPIGSPIGPAEAGDQRTNEGFTAELGWGDVDAALEQCNVVVTSRCVYPKLYAYAMETYTATARFADGRLEVLSSAQHPFQVQRELARIFELDLAHVQVRAPYIGGGFGSKSYTKLEPLAALCSRAVGGRPVRLVTDVEGAMYTTRADGADVEVVTGFDEDGIIQARVIDIVLDTGAYADNSPQVLRRCVTRAVGPYRIPALQVRARAVYTTTTPASSYRGFGGFHTSVATEGNLDQAADRLGIDRAELRLRNLVGQGEQHIPGMRAMDADLHSDLRALVAELQLQPRSDRLQGLGFACVASDAGARPTSNALVRLLADGSVVLHCGSAEMGQGSRTVLTSIVAEELGVERDQVRLVASDTAATPFQWTTGASRTTTIVGLSVQRACQHVVAQLFELAQQLTDGDEGQVELVEGQVRYADGRTVTPSEVLAAWFGDGWGEIVGIGRTQQRGDIDPLPAFWEIGMVGAAVDVDPETGEVEVQQLVTLGDVGRAILPEGVEGQDLGAAMQGLGGALHEELIYDGPQIVNANLVEYRVPRIVDLPPRRTSLVMERGDGIGPYGAKGVGEGAMTAVGAAIASAVATAVGRWPERLPLTPQRVCELLDEAATDCVG